MNADEIMSRRLVTLMGGSRSRVAESAMWRPATGAGERPVRVAVDPMTFEEVDDETGVHEQRETMLTLPAVYGARVGVGDEFDVVRHDERLTFRVIRVLESGPAAHVLRVGVSQRARTSATGDEARRFGRR